jgi:hypothetical protein
MGFFEDDESILLMDIPNCVGREFTLDEFKQLRDVGVRTTIPFYNYWGEIELQYGHYSWDALDGRVAKARAAGMKVLIPCYTAAPAWVPEDWVVQKASGPSAGMLDPWNAQAQLYSLGFYKLMAERYAAKDVQVINHYLTHGETLGLNEPFWFSAEAQRSWHEYSGQEERQPYLNTEQTDTWFRQSMFSVWLRQQQVLMAAGFELWCNLHPAINTYYACSHWVKEAIGELRRWAGDEVVIHQTYYTWVQWQHLWPKMWEIRNKYNTQIWGGAEYAEGAPGTAVFAKQQQLRGMLCGPCHPFTGHSKLEPWIAINLRMAMEAMR